MSIHGYPGGKLSATPPTPSNTAAPGIWTLEKQAYYNAQGSWPPNVTAPISRSVRLRASASAYFNRTIGTPTNNKICTFSFWAKRGALQSAGSMGIIGTSGGDYIDFNNDNMEIRQLSGGGGRKITTAVFRDPSAWYHFVFQLDTTDATAANRIKIWQNGVQLTSFSLSTDPSQNSTWSFNVASAAVRLATDFSSYFDGYLTEMYFIDGQSLAPTSFGAFDAVTGVWNPIVYTGTYGTNGFYLTFSDNSAATAAAIGKDSSGNGNNWTPNNISVTNVTAPNTNDSMVDTPTNYGVDTGAGGEVRGNYAVLSVPASSTWTFSNANMTGYGGTYNCYFSMPIIGKMYFEVYCSGFVGGGQVGFVKNATIALASVGYNAAGYYGVNYAPTNSYWVNGTNDATTHGTVTNQTMKFAVDGATGKVWIGSGSTWFGSGDPAAGTNPAFTISLSTGDLIFPMLTSQQVRDTFTINTGQQTFGNAAPSGFKAMCTQNMTTPTISNGANYMAATLYTGNGSTQSITNTVNGISFQPDFVWTKPRVAASSNALFDSVRGASKILISNSTAAESNLSPYGVTAFNSNGFSLSDDSAGDYYVNGASGGTYSGTPPNYVGWQWKGGGTAVTNTSGTITSSVSANTSAGFSVVTYTSTTGTVGHGLGVAPSMIIMKGRNVTDQWTVGHASLNGGSSPWNYGLPLQDTAAIQTNSGFWNNTAPTSTVFSQGSWDSGYTKVAYCWAAISGYSAFGSFVGNGVPDGPFIYLGFRPRYVLVKVATAAANWAVLDSSRDTYNVMSNRLFPNSALGESTLVDPTYDFTANGFKLRTDNATENYSGQTIIYAAFAENPFTIARAR